MRSRPLIGVTTYPPNEQGSFHLPAAYVEAVRMAGGLPVLFPPGDQQPGEILEIVDGLIFAGGGDVDPSLYGAPPHPTIERLNRERDEFEISLAKLAFGAEQPVLGICRGSQILNVAAGGTLIRDIPEEIGEKILHRGKDRQPTDHQISIEKMSRLAAIVGSDRIAVRSKHHQGLKDIPAGWRVVARSEDGLVEAVENDRHRWMMSVLWHPELALDDDAQRRLFSAFLEAAREQTKKKSGRR